MAAHRAAEEALARSQRQLDSALRAIEELRGVREALRSLDERLPAPAGRGGD
jgi:hypothetical protein